MVILLESFADVNVRNGSQREPLLLALVDEVEHEAACKLH